MAVKVEMMITVCINGRPLWRKAKTMRAELTHRMTDKEYDRVLDASIKELSTQVVASKAAEKAKEKVAA